MNTEQDMIVKNYSILQAFTIGQSQITHVCTVCYKSIAHTKVSQGAWPIQFEKPWSGDSATGHSPPLTYDP